MSTPWKVDDTVGTPWKVDDTAAAATPWKVDDVAKPVSAAKTYDPREETDVNFALVKICFIE